MDLKSYVHWRAPRQADKIKVRETKGLTQTTDFLDTIHADEPAVHQPTPSLGMACVSPLWHILLANAMHLHHEAP